MNQELIQTLEDLVEKACRKDTNIFGYQVWTNHIKVVIQLAEQLSSELECDTEVVIIASILHDYAGIIDKEMYTEHHIHGARIAGELLESYGYDQEKTELVKQCIYSHRGSKNIKRFTREEICVASADAMAHIDQVSSLFSLAFNRHHLSVEKGSEFVLKKINRSYHKLCDEAKELIKDKYYAARLLLQEYE